jgi:DNA-binding beta-propeller fold protein YncE
VSSYSTTTNTHVARFDLTSGAYLNTVVSIPNTLSMTDMMVGPDGLLYVGSDARQAMLRFTTAGVPMPAPGRLGIADFTGQGFLPRGILYRPQDGFFYMSSFGNNAIYRLDPATGNATSIYAGFNSLFGETLGPDGNIYFSHDNDIWKYEFGASTASLFADVNGVFRMDFGPDVSGDAQPDLFHVALDGRVRVANGVTGAALPDFFAPGTGGLSAAINLQWVEVPEPASIGFLALGALLVCRRLKVS